MGKRFTETNKWDDPWYRELTPQAKHGWNYLLDKCDAAGVISLDRKLADFQIGEAVDWDALIANSEGRIERLSERKLWLPGFIPFQVGRLSVDCKAHNPIFASLEKHGLIDRVSNGIPKGIQTLQEKDKEEEKDKDKEKEGVQGKPKSSPFDAWWEIVHCKTGKEAARRAYDGAVSKIRMVEPDVEPHAYLRERMVAFAATPSAKPTDRSPIHPTTWLNQGRYADDPETWNQRGSPANGKPAYNPAAYHKPGTETRHEI
jgi:hypothetical protein